MVRGVILAAGASTRMGRPKAGLSISDRADTFLSRLIRSFLAAGLPEIVIVSGAAPDVVRRAAIPFTGRVRVVQNMAWESGQLSSVVAGLDETASTNLEAILMTLVDVPLIRPDTIRSVLREWRRTQAPIVRPARGDEHGHPVIFDRVLFAALRRADPSVGAKAVVRAHTHEIVNVPIEDPGAFTDVDTVDDYERLRRSLSPT